MKQFIGVLVVLFFSAAASAENWPSWRGPDQNGVGPKGPFQLPGRRIQTSPGK